MYKTGADGGGICLKIFFFLIHHDAHAQHSNSIRAKEMFRKNIADTYSVAYVLLHLG